MNNDETLFFVVCFRERESVCVCVCVSEPFPSLPPSNLFYSLTLSLSLTHSLTHTRTHIHTHTLSAFCGVESMCMTNKEITSPLSVSHALYNIFFSFFLPSHSLSSSVLPTSPSLTRICTHSLFCILWVNLTSDSFLGVDA